MKILFHIGDAKAGSTAIQTSLHTEKKTLLDFGILYHAPSINSGHFSYATLYGRQTRADDEEQKRIARANIDETRDLIRRHQPDWLIISAESLYSFSPEEVSDITTTLLGGSAQETHVFAYVREPSSFYMSMVQQSLKADHRFPAPHRYIRDFSRTPKRWLAEPDLTSLTIRLFDRSRLLSGSTVADFSAYLADLTGKRFPGLPESTANSSLSAEQLVLLQNYRAAYLYDYAGQFHAESTNLLKLFQNWNSVAGPIGTVPRLRDDARTCVIEQNLQYVEELDALIPDIGMASVAQNPKVSWKAAPWRTTGTVGNVIDSFDWRLLGHFKSFVPKITPEIEHGDISKPLEAIRVLKLRKPQIAAYKRYLKVSGYDGAAQAMETALPS